MGIAEEDRHAYGIMRHCHSQCSHTTEERSEIMSTTPRHHASRALSLLPVLSAGLVAAALAGATAHGHAAAPVQMAPEQITVRASAPHLPKQLPAGILALTFVNDTASGADASLARANPGATLAQINAASDATNGQGPAALKAFVRLTQLVTFVGGVNSLAPGTSGTAFLDLRTPGLHGLHIGGDNGPGTTLIFTVLAGAGQQATPPPATLTVRLKDMKFLGLPRRLAAGWITIRVANQGPSVHEMALLKLDPGKTEQDVLDFIRSPQGETGPEPSWVHSAGGMDTLAPRQSAGIRLNLTPGTYVAVCFLPDAKKQLPHVMEGMIGSFAVR